MRLRPGGGAWGDVCLLGREVLGATGSFLRQLGDDRYAAGWPTIDLRRRRLNSCVMTLSGQQGERGDVRGSDDVEVSPVEGGYRTYVETFGDRDDGRVDRSEGEIGVLQDQFAHARQVDGCQVDQLERPLGDLGEKGGLDLGPSFQAASRLRSALGWVAGGARSVTSAGTCIRRGDGHRRSVRRRWVRCRGRWRSRRVAEAFTHPITDVVVVPFGEVLRAVDAADRARAGRLVRAPGGCLRL